MDITPQDITPRLYLPLFSHVQWTKHSKGLWKLKILLYLSNEYWTIHTESSNTEKMLFQNIPYSQDQSNQIFSQTHDTSQREKAFEICEILSWIFKSFVVERRKNTSASVLQRHAHKYVWETCECAHDNETPHPSHMDIKCRSSDWMSGIKVQHFHHWLPLNPYCYYFNYYCLGFNLVVVLAGHLHYLLITYQLKIVKECTLLRFFLCLHCLLS